MIKTQSTKHTPGPWTSKPFGVPQWDDDPLGVYVIPEVKRKLEFADDAATDFVNDETEYGRRMDAIHAEQQANAKLIAQAPAMAEALTECHHLLTYLADGEEMEAANNGCVWSMERVERAIQNVRDVLRDAGVLV